jgi:hypothetical protein
MSLIFWVTAACVALSAVLVRIFVKNYMELAGERVITCPENGCAAGVKLDAALGATRAVLGEHTVKIAECSRWPEKAGCGQECLAQIEAAPEGCRVRALLTHWYEGKSCARCHKDLSPASWPHNRPALRSPDGHTLAWKDVRAENVPAVLETHQPVCFDCHIVSRLVHEHPDRVVYRGR